MNVLGATYPLLDAFWTMLWFFGFLIWIYILVSVLIDVFRSDDLSGWGKAFWLIFVLVLPLVGVLVYLIARGAKMHERAARQAQRQEDEVRRYVQGVTGSSGSAAEEVEKLASLRDQGVISAEEFERQKARVLS